MFLVADIGVKKNKVSDVLVMLKLFVYKSKFKLITFIGLLLAFKIKLKTFRVGRFNGNIMLTVCIAFVYKYLSRCKMY